MYIHFKGNANANWQREYVNRSNFNFKAKSCGNFGC